jgi:hypothetical protein
MPREWQPPSAEEEEEEEDEDEEDSATVQAALPFTARVTQSQGDAAAAGPGNGQYLPTHPDYKQTLPLLSIDDLLVRVGGEVSKIDPKLLPPVAPPPPPPNALANPSTWATDQGSTSAGGISQPDPSIRTQWNAHYQKYFRQRYDYGTG